MRLVDIEKDIKKILEEDGFSNPDKLYNAIYKLLLIFLQHRKLVSCQADAEEIAHIGAEELYMRVLSGHEIKSWLGYISLSYHGYVRAWRGITASEVIDTQGDKEKGMAIINMCTSGRQDDHLEHERISNYSYIEAIPLIIDEVLSESRYNRYTSDYYNARLSILMSLASSRYVSYNQSIDNELYTRMLYNRTKEIVMKNMNENIGNNEFDCGLTPLQLFTLSNMQRDEDING